MTEAELVQRLAGLPGVVTLTAGPDNGAPEVAWGDSFFYYDPENIDPNWQTLPFATVVVNDYPGFDTASNLARPGVFRLNLSVGRTRFEQLLGFLPAAFDERQDSFDYAAFDTVVPHPVYAKQSWISIVVPGERTESQVGELIAHAYGRAKRRYRAPGRSDSGGH